MYIEKISHDPSPYESLPEQTVRWPMIVRIGLIVMLFAGLAVGLATAPPPSDDTTNVMVADSPLAVGP